MARGQAYIIRPVIILLDIMFTAVRYPGLVSHRHQAWPPEQTLILLTTQTMRIQHPARLHNVPNSRQMANGQLMTALDKLHMYVP